MTLSSLELLLQCVRIIAVVGIIKARILQNRFENRLDYLLVLVLSSTVLTAIDFGIFIFQYIAEKKGGYYLYMSFMWFINVVDHALDMKNEK